MKSILRLVLACLTAFCIISLISCQGNEKTPVNANKYTLTQMISLGELVNIEETYNYYYIEFKDNNEFTLIYNMKKDNNEVVNLGSYTKTENMYIVNCNGMVMNFIINGNKLECDITITKFVFELEV